MTCKAPTAQALRVEFTSIAEAAPRRSYIKALISSTPRTMLQNAHFSRKDLLKTFMTGRVRGGNPYSFFTYKFARKKRFTAIKINGADPVTENVGQFFSTSLSYGSIDYHNVNF